MPEQQEARLATEAPYQKFIEGMKGYLERSSARMSMVLGLEQRNESLSGAEGVRFLGGVCQLVDDLITEQYVDREEDFPGAQQAIGKLTGKKVDDKVLQATEEAIEPWMQEFENLKPRIDREIKLKEDAADVYPIDKITGDKISFALNLLITAQSDQVTMLPKDMREQLAALKQVLKSVRGGLKEEQRFRELGWKGIVVSVSGVVLTIALAAGAIWGVSDVVTNPDFQKWLQNVPKMLEQAPIIGNPLTEKARNSRYEQYQNKKTTIVENKKWPDRVEAENMLNYFDPKTGYNEWKAIIEFCGPQCLVESQWAPGEGKRVIMDFLGVDEADYKDLQENPDKIGEQIEKMYPDNQPLIELFRVHPTIINSKGQSEFEKWMEDWSVQSRINNKQQTSLGAVRINNNAGIYQARRDQFVGQRQGYMSRGRGFGTPKGV